MEAAYDRIGRGYSGTRRTDPRIGRTIVEALGSAITVANVGAGTGSYEPQDRRVTAFEPSRTMIRQRPPGSAPAVEAEAERIPSDDDSFDAAMAILTIHHWTDPERGVREMRRIATGPVVVLTFEPDCVGRWWIEEYAPEIRDDDRGRFPPIGSIKRWLGGGRADTVATPADCEDLFLGSLWARPELVLDPMVRASTSGFARMEAAAEQRAVRRLRDDLASGEWDRRWGELRGLDSYDVGVRLVRSSP